MASRPPTPASCPIVLDRKEPGRELEPLQGPDHRLYWCLLAGRGGGGGRSQRLSKAHIPPQARGNGGGSDTLVL